MQIVLINNWLYELTPEGDRRLTWQEVDRISKGSGYYLKENFIAFLVLRFPGARFKIDSNYRVTSKITSWG